MSTFISRGPGWLSRFSDSLRSRRFGDRILVGKIYRTRPDWPCDPPSLLYNGYRVYPGVLWRGRGFDHPPPSSNEVKERVELNLFSPSGTLWCVLRRTLHSIDTSDRDTYPTQPSPHLGFFNRLLFYLFISHTFCFSAQNSKFE